MPLSYALLLCIPIGFLFFLVARLTSRLVIGRYGRLERRASFAFGFFGVLLIPDLWIFVCLHDKFTDTPGMAIGFLLFLVEWLVLVAIFRPFPKRGISEAEPWERIEP